MTEYGISTGDKVEKFHVALLFNSGTTASPVWKQLCKATENTISLNPETEDLDFIVDKNPTTIIKKYKPSLNNPLTLYKGEDDYSFFFNKFFNLPTGSSANGEMLIVFMNEATGTHVYRAWKCSVTYVFDSLDPVNSQLSMTTQVNGTIGLGSVTVTSGNPVFSSDTSTEFAMTVTVKKGSTAQASCTVICGGVEKTTGTDGTAVFNLIDGSKYVIGATNGTEEGSDVFTASSSTTSMDLTIA